MVPSLYVLGMHLFKEITTRKSIPGLYEICIFISFLRIDPQRLWKERDDLHFVGSIQGFSYYLKACFTFTFMARIIVAM